MKRKVALLAGGYTGEYVISLQTADTIAMNIDQERYEAYKIVIGREEWYYDDAQGRIPVDRNDFSIISGGERIFFDVALIAIHGSPGEDGKLQGYFDLLGIPYTTCDLTTSAITMNKSYTKSLLAGIQELYLSGSVQLFRNRPSDLSHDCGHLQLPLFVKPNNGGSSIGMSKVINPEDLGHAIEKAFREDGQVLVEEFVKGKEFSIGAFRTGGKLEVLPCTEIITGREFFDFEAKYSPGISEEITPGRLNETERSGLESLVRQVYDKLNCRGAVRMDFIQEEGTGRWYFIEINTVPGQSENSILPRQVRAGGRTMKEFYTLLLEEALT